MSHSIYETASYSPATDGIIHPARYKWSVRSQHDRPNADHYVVLNETLPKSVEMGSYPEWRGFASCYLRNFGAALALTLPDNLGWVKWGQRRDNEVPTLVLPNNSEVRIQFRHLDGDESASWAVSYTHLTLPTIYSV